MQIALFQPDIPPNTGTIIRMAACLNITVNIIDPCGFAFGEKSFRRAGMDYIDQGMIRRHKSWDHFVATTGSCRIILLTTAATRLYTDISYRPDDIILLGRETAGVPEDVHRRADKRVIIPMAANRRSLNIAVATAMVTGEVLRQTGLFH
ncbi:MAG: tRNA (cytidine(34)-2'-O)-methyltransferase [Alphaproteobacteria bacterium]|nr:tRNA (cytidine(34)-2'-O)-methyltransferase [Alphaproteobacteria bacterium]